MIEVLIASAVLTAIMMGLASLVSFNQKVLKSTASKNEFNNLVSSIQGILDNSKNCETVLGAFNFTSPPSTAGALYSPQTIAPLKTLGNSGAVLADLGLWRSSLEVTNLEFNYAAPLTVANQYLVTLHLEAQKIVEGGAVGSRKLKHDFQLSLTIDPANSNKIVRCLTSNDALWQKGANPGEIFYPGGNVGIGTSESLWSPFMIAAPVSMTVLSAGLATMTIANTDPDPNIHNIFYFANCGLFSSAAVFTVQTVNTNFGDNLIFATKQDAVTSGGSPGQWNEDQVALNANGYVGIGSCLPATKLQITGTLTPATSGSYTLGTAALKWADVYSQNAANNTSDIREKKEIQDSDLGLGFIEKLRPVSYRWKNTPDQGLHYGLIAQEAERALREAKESDELAIVAYDKPADRYGLRYSELTSPLIRAVQELYDEVESLIGRMGAVQERGAAKNRELASLTIEPKFETDRLEAENAALKVQVEEAEKESAAIKNYLCAKDPDAAFCF